MMSNHTQTDQQHDVALPSGYGSTEDVLSGIGASAIRAISRNGYFYGNRRPKAPSLFTNVTNVREAGSGAGRRGLER
jgi:hypothetical protein